jgi:protein-L-isoaspartate(D-aspartate) O-methyltransferase
MPPFAPSDPYREARKKMVFQQLTSRDIWDKRVIQAFLSVPRHLFIPKEHWNEAYEDHPVAIGEEQTISQPYMVALMTQSLKLQGDERLLEIGTGSGYQTAILAQLVREVITIERISSLLALAQERLKSYPSIEFHLGDGTQGYPEKAPYSAILVAAATPKPPPALLDQLAEGGRLVLPVGTLQEQDLLLVEKKCGTLVSTSLGGCRFVPLIGKNAWQKP